MNITTIAISAFYLLLPAYFANMAPVVFNKRNWLEFLNRPIDGGRHLNGRPILGPNKTWRGLVSGIILAMVVASIQGCLYEHYGFNLISLFDYSQPLTLLIFGFLAGFGAIFGDAAKSFFKRGIGIKSGKSWPVFDQLDFVIGFLVFTCLIVKPSLEIILACLVISIILHPLINILAYLLRIKKVWY
jgi:CDP-2,3-bis-(O-geranylgeranyl)-sn-glycerol synthase